MNEPNGTEPGGLPQDLTRRTAEHVSIELPWVPLPGDAHAFLTQIVVADRAHAVMDAVKLYARCRAAPTFNLSKHRSLTSLLWHVLQAACPYYPWQWWEWERACMQFHQAASRFLGDASP